jgi:hypothetical protein
VTNGECDVEGTGLCRCSPGFSVTVYGECYIDYGRNCTQRPPLTCNPSKFFRCDPHRNSCTCVNEDTQAYDPERGAHLLICA